MIGTVFAERYRIENLLGQGGMGAVYRAHDLVLDRDVAVKVLSKASIGSQGRSKLLNEARAAAHLNHPNIITIFDAGEADHIAYIVMEMIDGGSLHEQPLTGIDQLLMVARQICLALDHAHARGIVHRDLKPENVLLTPEGQVKLMDFGLARSVASRLTTEGSISGSVFYLAPELALGQEYDGRADLYALGVMIYELAVGELPFTAEDPLAVISQHLHAPVTPPRARREDIPPGLNNLILRLMSKRPEDRPASAGEVAQALEQIAAGETGVDLIGTPSLLDGIVRGRLVGREKELGEAVRSWDAARAGKSSVLLISGEPGIGKTRLACELIAMAQVQGAYILKGECYQEESSPYAPLAQIIETAAEYISLDQLTGWSEILSLAPGLRMRFPELAEKPQNGHQAEQQQLFDSLVELFMAVSRQTPVLLFLEDAHWADSGSLFFLRHLARRAARLKLRLMILMTYREFELEEGRTLNQVLYDFQHEHLSLRIKLSRLTHADTEQFLTSFLHEDVDCEFLEHVYKETEGNPFFIEEVCKALIEAGDLYRQCGCWHWPVMAEIEIPQSIKVAIQARVGKLPSETQDVLRTASIFGREFDFTDLCEVSELSENQLLEALENAERAQLVSVLRRPGKGRSAVIAFNFSHALIASSLRESMSSLRRQRLHHKVGLALERLHSDRMEQLAPQLGRHFAEAGLPEKAVDYLLQAGDVARQVFAYPEAIEYYQNALLILKEQDDFGRASHTLIKLGLLYHSTLDFESSRKAYQEGFNLWRQASETQPTSLASDPLRIASYPPITFDPGLAYENNSVPYIDQLFVGLVSLTEDLDVVPELAESWEVLENGQKYIFHLRKDAYWSDGQPVTAGDIEFAWKRILTPETRSRNHVLFYDIRGARDYVEGRLTDSNEIGVRARDPYTLEVELEQPASYFLHLLTYAATFPVPPHAVKAFGSDWTQVENIVTNGPFILEYYHPNKEIGFTRNSQYSGKRSGNLERAEINISPDMADFSTRLADYEAGKLDAIGFGGLAMESDRARQKHAGEYVTIPVAMVSFLVFRLWQAPFDDVRIRRAFVQSIDREMLAEVCLHGYAAPALSGLVPPGLPGHLGEPGLPFNPNEARRLLADAGYPNGKGMPEIDVWLITPENSEMMEFIQENWLEHLGVASRWITMTAGEMYGRLQREDHPSVFFNGWLADYPDPDTFLRVAIAYQTSWHYPPYEELIEKARRSPNQAERMNLYHQAERILIQEAPVMPMFYGRSHIFIQPWVRRFPISPIQPLILKDVVLERRD